MTRNCFGIRFWKCSISLRLKWDIKSVDFTSWRQEAFVECPGEVRRAAVYYILSRISTEEEGNIMFTNFLCTHEPVVFVLLLNCGAPATLGGHIWLALVTSPLVCSIGFYSHKATWSRCLILELSCKHVYMTEWCFVMFDSCCGYMMLSAFFEIRHT